MDPHREDATPRQLPADRARLVEETRPVAQGLGRRWATRYGQGDDFEQAAMAALVAAAIRFDPDRGVPFKVFAVKTITGELKRFRRSTAWGVNVTRPLQERFLAVAAARDALTAQYGRVPTIAEIANLLGCAEDEVLEAADAGHAMMSTSLDTGGSDGAELHERLAAVDKGYETIEERDLIETAMTVLSPREREIVTRYYWLGASQSDIARALGISQMHVSRLLGRSADKMREAVASR
jgi:RNA polymerase sigma-B factor